MSTIKDVAKLAGVSCSTVSRTLSNRAFVEEETRQKVLKAVEALDYRPSMLAKGLREGRCYRIAFMVPDINSFFYPMIMKSIEKYAMQKGYSVILCNNEESLALEKKNMEMMGSGAVDGILCMSVSDEIQHFERFQKERGIPVVLVNRKGSEDIVGIEMDDEYGGYVMTKYLLQHGHRKIAAMFGNFDNQRFRDRCRGCKRAMEEYGVEGYKRYFIYDADSIQEAYERTMDVLAKENRPTAFFASMDILSIGIYRGIDESGMKVGEDISVAGYDNITISEYMNPPLTTYGTPVDWMAQEGVGALIDRIERRERQVQRTRRGEVIERRSVRNIMAQ